jgi:hypothetical protein
MLAGFGDVFAGISHGTVFHKIRKPAVSGCR